MAHSQNTIARLDSITLKRAGKELLSGITLEISRGEHLLFSGKAETARIVLEMLAGLIHPGSGNRSFPALEELVPEHLETDPLFSVNRFIVLVNARPDFRNRAHMADLYYQQRFNSTENENSLTVKEYLAEEAVLSPYRENWASVMHDFDLESLSDEPLIKLSSGETRRLQLAAAMLKNPKLLLLDNPMAGLDAANRQHLEKVFFLLLQQGVTLVQTGSRQFIPASVSRVVEFGDKEIVSMEKPPFETLAASIQPEEPVQAFPDIPTVISSSFTEIIKMRDVSVRYGEKTILKSINWTVLPGECWRLSGKNGAGKSTLISLINGDNPQAFAHDIILFDRKKGSGESIWDIKARTGFFSPELFRYFPRAQRCMDVIESGFYDTAGLFRVSHAGYAEAARQWLKYFNLDGYATSSFAQVPETVQRICLLIRALIKLPPLLLLDEPCQGLDELLTKKFQRLLKEIYSHRRVTMVYVSHYDHELPDIITHELELDKGMISRITRQA